MLRAGLNVHVGPRPPRRRPARPAGIGVKNNDRIRVRTRRYKIKRMMAQARNVDVRDNGRVVRRMVVRRETLFPGAPRRRVAY